MKNTRASGHMTYNLMRFKVEYVVLASYQSIGWPTTLTQLVTVLKTPLCILLLTIIHKFQSERGVHMHPPAPPLPTGLLLSTGCPGIIATWLQRGNYGNVNKPRPRAMPSDSVVYCHNSWAPTNQHNYCLTPKYRQCKRDADVMIMYLNSAESDLAEGQLAKNISTKCTNLTFNVVSPHDSETLALYASNGPQSVQKCRTFQSNSRNTLSPLQLSNWITNLRNE